MGGFIPLLRRNAPRFDVESVQAEFPARCLDVEIRAYLVWMPRSTMLDGVMPCDWANKSSSVGHFDCHGHRHGIQVSNQFRHMLRAFWVRGEFIFLVIPVRAFAEVINWPYRGRLQESPRRSTPTIQSAKKCQRNEAILIFTGLHGAASTSGVIPCKCLIPRFSEVPMAGLEPAHPFRDNGF